MGVGGGECCVHEYKYVLWSWVAVTMVSRDIDQVAFLGSVHSIIPVLRIVSLRVQLAIDCACTCLRKHTPLYTHTHRYTRTNRRERDRERERERQREREREGRLKDDGLFKLFIQCY